MGKETNKHESNLPLWAVNLRAIVKRHGSPQVFAKYLHDTAVKFRRPTLSVKNLIDLMLSAQRGNAEAMNTLMRDYNVNPFMTSFQKLNTDEISKRPRWMASRETWKRIVNTVFPQSVEAQEKEAV